MVHLSEISTKCFIFFPFDGGYTMFTLNLHDLNDIYGIQIIFTMLFEICPLSTKHLEEN